MRKPRYIQPHVIRISNRGNVTLPGVMTVDEIRSVLYTFGYKKHAYGRLDIHPDPQVVTLEMKMKRLEQQQRKYLIALKRDRKRKR